MNGLHVVIINKLWLLAFIDTDEEEISEMKSQLAKLVLTAAVAGALGMISAPSYAVDPTPPVVSYDHFTCYDISGNSIYPKKSVTLKNQFGTVYRVKVGKALALCVPTNKSDVKNTGGSHGNCPGKDKYDWGHSKDFGNCDKNNSDSQD